MGTIIEWYEGLHGRFPFADLEYERASIEHAVNYDPFHSFMNLSGKLLNVLKGVKGKEDKSIILGMCEGRTPQIQLSKSVPVADDDAALIAEEEANNPNNNKKKKKKR